MFKKFIIFIAVASIAAIMYSCSGIKVATSEAVSDETKQVNSEVNIETQDNNENVAERTIMYYMVGSDLEENSLSSTEIISDISKHKFPDNLNFIMMTGGSRKKNIEVTREDPELKEKFSKFYDISWEKNQILKFSDGYTIIENDFGNDDMTNKNTLEKFVTYVKKNYPAKKYDIFFSDHGGAGLNGFGGDTRYSNNSGSLSIKDLVEVFKNTNTKFNIVNFDACLMASFELMYVLEPYADYLIAAEETSFGGWNYSFLEKVVNDVNVDSIEYGKAAVDAFIANNESIANSLGLFSLNGFKAAIDESLTKFAKSMNKYLTEDDYLQSLYAILKETIGLGYFNIQDIRDLRDFLDFLAYAENTELPQDLKDNAAELWNKIEPFVIYYRTGKQKSVNGEENTGGINFVFPSEDVYYYEDKGDSALVSMNNYPESLNEEYRLMYKLAFLRKALIKELKENTYQYDDDEVLDILDNICQRGIDKYKIPKNYIDKIKEKIVPNLSVNRIKSGPDGNIDFEKRVNDKNEILFDYIFDTNMSWMVYEPVATARTFGFDGKELKLGDVVLPVEESTRDDYLIWTIKPKEDRWFTIKYDDEEVLSQFIITEDERNIEAPSNLDYIFDKSISGFIPAILRRYEKDNDEQNIIQIHVEFSGNNKEGKVIGFTRYDQNANMSAKEMESFKPQDKVLLIANFEDFRKTKNISYLYTEVLDAVKVKPYRGYMNSQSIYFKYSIEDIYGEVYDCDVQNMFGFELNDGSNDCLYATFPSTWTDVVINQIDSSFESTSNLEKHSEKLKIDLFDVTNNAHFSDMKEGEEYSEEIKKYLENKTYNYIDYSEQYFIETEKRYLPVLNIMGDEKNNSYVNKKYVFFERENKKYLIELSSIIDLKENNYYSYHDMRLLKSAIELVNSPAEKDEYLPILKVEEMK